jgi:hypothetical protein
MAPMHSSGSSSQEAHNNTNHPVLVVEEARVSGENHDNNVHFPGISNPYFSSDCFGFFKQKYNQLYTLQFASCFEKFHL